MMFKVTSNLSKTIGKVGKWTQNKAQEFNNLAQFVKNSLSKASRKETVFQQQSAHQSWKSQLQNFRTTLKENATRLQQQLNYRNGLSENSYFRNDFLWRRARQAHLIAFGGLFLFQEERHEKLTKLDSQYQIYSNVCSNIKTLFPSYAPDDALPEDCGSKLNDYMLEKVVDSSSNSVSYQARLKPDEDDFDICEETPESKSSESYVLLNDLPWDLPITTSETREPDCFGEYCVKAITPHGGIRNIETVVKHSENELVCCGRGHFGNHLGIDGKWPRKKLPPHPNIVRIEEAFVDDFVDISDSLHATEEALLPDMLPVTTKALYLVTKRYKTTLKHHLEQNNVTADQACVVILQLLEAVAHLQEHNVVHRDINSSNVVLEWDADRLPHVLLGEFGKSYCAGSWRDMKVPFEHETLDTRVGKLSSQAPEISKARPGFRNFVNYQNSDSWSVGALAYEILTGRNPFDDADDDNTMVLDSRTYSEEDLPRLDDPRVPDVLKMVVKMLLGRDLNKRLTAAEAADILHFELFALPPSFNLPEDTKCEELRSWIVAHCAEVFARQQKRGILYQTCQSFFSRLDPKKLSQGFYMWMLVKNASDNLPV